MSWYHLEKVCGLYLYKYSSFWASSIAGGEEIDKMSLTEWEKTVDFRGIDVIIKTV